VKQPNTQLLVAAAARAREHAYAPYSRFKVGAAVQLTCGAVHTGVNVENASLGLTVCAERHAVAAAVLAGARPGDITAIAIAAQADMPVAPCGACRQVLVEFAAPSLPVFLHNVGSGETEEHTLGELLPHAFARDRLPSS
jgi:cytidine deaminase